MTENLWPKDRGLQARFSVLSNLLGWAWLFPGAHILSQPSTQGPVCCPSATGIQKRFPLPPKALLPRQVLAGCVPVIPGNSKFLRMGIGGVFKNYF